MEFKKLDYHNLPEDCYMYCNCGQKYRSEDNWWYSERSEEDNLKINQLKNMFDLLNINNFQKYTYKCPECYSKENFNSNEKYKKSELIEFCKKYNIEHKNNEKKSELHKKLIKHLE